jgi:hypothetical protein
VEHTDEVAKLLRHGRSNDTARSTGLESRPPESAQRPCAEPLLTEKLIAISHVKRAAEEVHAQNYLGFVQLASAIICFRMARDE